MTNLVRAKRPYSVSANTKARRQLVATLAVPLISVAAEAQQATPAPSATDQASVPQTVPSATFPEEGAASAPSNLAAPAAPSGATSPNAAAATTPPTHSAEQRPAEAILVDAEQLAPSPIPKAFIDSFFALRLELGGGGPFGGIIDQEKNSQISVVYSDGSVKTANVSHNAFHFGANVEVSALRAKSVKLTLRGGYLYTKIGQSATLGGGQYETKTFDATLLETHAALFGPVIYFGKKWFGSFQVLGGPLTGTLHPIPLGEQIEGFNVPDYAVSGWLLRVGPGFGYAWKTFLIGCDLLYSRSSFSSKDVVYTNLGSSLLLSTIEINGFVGLHF